MYLTTVARLKAGVSLEQAGAEMGIIAREIAKKYPDESHHQRGAKAELMRQNLSGNAAVPIVSMLLGAVGFVLLLACVNVANLQLARVSLRTREIALRFALGAGRLRILMQFLVESVLLSLAGAVAGAFAAIWATNVLHSAMPAEVLKFLPGWERLGLNSHVLLFTLAAGALSGVISGFAPAFFASRTHLNETLKEAARGASSGVRRHRTRNAFVVAQIVLALVLLVGAELMVKGLRLVTAPAPNLDPVHALAMRVTLADARYPSPQERWIFQQRVLDRVSTLPGVESAALVRDLPYSGYGGSVNVAIRGQVIVPSRPLPPVRDESVSPDYFRTLHLPIAAGRPFTQHDSRNSTPVAIVSQSCARRHFPNENPIGKQLKIGKPDSGNPWLTIVGVAGDIRMDPFEYYYPRILYRPIQQAAPGSFCLLLRTSDPGKLIAASRAEIHAIDPDLPVYDAMSLEKLFGLQLAPVNLIAGLMASFGVLALILSSVGVYSIMVHAVSERRHEIGVRMALGAMTSEVVWLFVRQSLTLAAIGVAIGMPAAFGLARMLEGRFFGVKASDAPTFAIALLIITVAAVAASYSAAQRAARLDPVATLREE